jgi:hypothetical protein
VNQLVDDTVFEAVAGFLVRSVLRRMAGITAGSTRAARGWMDVVVHLRVHPKLAGTGRDSNPAEAPPIGFLKEFERT